MEGAPALCAANEKKKLKTIADRQSTRTFMLPMVAPGLSQLDGEYTPKPRGLIMQSVESEKKIWNSGTQKEEPIFELVLSDPDLHAH
jgi:hypothetical protein